MTCHAAVRTALSEALPAIDCIPCPLEIRALLPNRVSHGTGLVPFLAASPDLVRRYLLCVAIVEFPRCRLAPTQWRLQRRARPRRRLKQAQRPFQCRRLRLGILWTTCGVPQRKITKEIAGHAAVFGNIPGTPHYHRGDPLALQLTGNEA